MFWRESVWLPPNAKLMTEELWEYDRPDNGWDGGQLCRAKAENYICPFGTVCPGCTPKLPGDAANDTSKIE